LSTLFYKLIKQQRGKLSRFIEELQVDDQIFQSHDNIMCGWNKHFGQLAHKSDYEKFDIKFLELIEKEREIISNSNFESTLFTQFNSCILFINCIGVV
jgi:hypothetical protein